MNPAIAIAIARPLSVAFLGLIGQNVAFAGGVKQLIVSANAARHRYLLICLFPASLALSFFLSFTQHTFRDHSNNRGQLDQEHRKTIPYFVLSDKNRQDVWQRI